MSNRRKLPRRPRKEVPDNCFSCNRNDVPLVKTAIGSMCFDCLGRMEALVCRVCNPDNPNADSVCEKHFNEARDQ